jgi:hypothetical protein
MFPTARRSLLAAMLCPALCLVTHPATAQTTQADITNRLLKHPLYLRDAWQEDRLEFNEHGKPLHPEAAHRGPVTLSGIDITGIKHSGNQLRLDGLRVALIAPDPAQPLQRATSIGSTTRIFPSLMPGDKKFNRATEHIQITIHADAQGGFNEALTAIFADGLAQLASSVPPFWHCYAASYFVDTPPPANATETVQHCAATQSDGVHFNGAEPATVTPPSVIQSSDPTFTRAAAELRLQGDSEVYVTVEPDGLPSGFQVIQPLGAGLDEETLRAAAHYTFRPATLHGQPVRAGFLIQNRYGTQP